MIDIFGRKPGIYFTCVMCVLLNPERYLVVCYDITEHSQIYFIFEAIILSPQNTYIYIARVEDYNCRIVLVFTCILSAWNFESPFF